MNGIDTRMHAPHAGRGRRWPAMIVGLLSLNAGVVAVTVFFAGRDGSFAVEPDYYRKAVEWDSTARERDRGAAAGWDVDVGLAGDPAAGAAPLLRVSVRESADPGARPVEGLQVHAEAFAQARSGQRTGTVLNAAGNGVYQAEMPIWRPGVWEVRLRVKDGPESLSFMRTLRVPDRRASGATP